MAEIIREIVPHLQRIVNQVESQYKVHHDAIRSIEDTINFLRSGKLMASNRDILIANETGKRHIRQEDENDASLAGSDTEDGQKTSEFKVNSKEL